MVKNKILVFTIAVCTLLILNIKPINAQCHIDDWTALKTLYESTKGDNWNKNDGWEIVKENTPPQDCNLENLYGIGVDTNGRVDSLNLYQNRLYGTIPLQIVKLNNLRELVLSANNIWGVIPPEIGSISSLLRLSLGANALSGKIPTELGNLENLVSLTLNGNNLRGNIPTEIGNLNNLENLSLSGNSNLNGSIPPVLGNLSKLKALHLYSNNFSGKIPTELGNLYNLETLILYDNQLSGSIPTELSNLSNLKYLFLNSNELSGSIPVQLGNLVGLDKLYLSSNQLSGNIPPELSKLNINDLDLSNNRLSGRIPPELSKLNIYKLDLSNNQLSESISPELSKLNIYELDLSNNQLSGSIPPELANLKLEKLDLSNNLLSGSIPTELGNLKLHESATINLSYNQLSGSIPIEMGNISNLIFLNLSNNLLSGAIPAEIGNATSLAHLDISNNQLTGSLPNELSNIFLYHLDVSHNALSGKLVGPNGDYYVGDIGLFDISHNYYNCNEIIEYYPSLNSYFGPFNFTPQKYSHNAPKSYLISSSNESIALSAPYEIQNNFTYQWYKNNVPIEGATDTILYLNSVQSEDVGDYTLQINNADCKRKSGQNKSDTLSYVSEPISVRRTDLEGCTDVSACNYNQFAMIDDGNCEYLSCDTLTNPIKIRTANETILSDTQIKFDLVIDSLGLDYSADGLTINLDTGGNYNFESIKVVNPVLSIVEVDISQLYNNIISIDRINSQRLVSNEPVISIIGCIVAEDIPSDEETCSHFAISGGTELSSGHFIRFDDIYIDIPFSDCSPYGGYGAEGENWLPVVITISPQNCNLPNDGFINIKILEEGQSPFNYILKNEEGETLYGGSSANETIEINGINAGNYELTIWDANEKQIQRHICVPLLTNVDSNETCNTDCTDYLIIPDGEITGTHVAKKEIEIRGFITGNETVIIDICD